MLTRFAPSPTGYLHLGHAYAAAQAFGFGPCLLRIEDIDSVRCKSEYTDAIYEDLAWLGFKWPKPARQQSRHLPDYQAALSSLNQRGLLYRCFKTRSELPSGIYRGAADPDQIARLNRGEAFAWRLSVERARGSLGGKALTYMETGIEPGEKRVDYDALSDEVLARKDIGNSYFLACTHDDALQNITHIVRGIDIQPLTGFQLLLQNLMNWPVPIYHHHGLLMGEDGKKLSKRSGDMSVRALSAQGFTSGQVLSMAQP